MIKRNLLLVLLMMTLCALPTDARPGGGGFGHRSSRAPRKSHQVRIHSTLGSKLRRAQEHVERTAIMRGAVKSAALHKREPLRIQPMLTLGVKSGLNPYTTEVAKRLERLKAMKDASEMNEVKRWVVVRVLPGLDRSGNLRQDSLGIKFVVPGLAPPGLPSSGLKGVLINGDKTPSKQ